VGLRLVAFAAAIALFVAGPAGGGAIESTSSFLAAAQRADGGFAEVGSSSSDPALTAWVVLALEAAGRDPSALRAGGRSAADYLAEKPYPKASDLALRLLALRALGNEAAGLADRLASLRRADGSVGGLINTTAWSVLALEAAGRPSLRPMVHYLLRRQRPSGGWSWHPGGAPDSNDTAVVVQALRAAGLRARSPVLTRALRYLRRLQNKDGGFALVPGRASDSQSTAWAFQAFLAAGMRPGRAAAYLERMRRPDGSFRYSARYAITPVWVSAQVLPALAGKSLPYP
jgi:prenyltransferase beta subunit